MQQTPAGRLQEFARHLLRRRSSHQLSWVDCKEKFMKIVEVILIISVTYITTLMYYILSEYFRNSLFYEHAKLQLTIEQADWIVAGKEVFEGIVAIILVYYSSKNRNLYTGVVLLLLSITSMTLIMVQQTEYPANNYNSTLCRNSSAKYVQDSNGSNIGIRNIILVLVFQAISALVSVLISTHAIMKLESRFDPTNSIVAIAGLITVKYVGTYFGNYMSFLSLQSKMKHIFSTVSWVSSVVFTGFMALYTAISPDVVQEKLNASSQNLKNNFKLSMQRNFHNMGLLFHLLATMLMVIAVANYANVKNLLSLRSLSLEYMSDDHNEWINLILSTNIKPIIATLSTCVVGLALAYVKPRMSSVGMTLIVFKIVVGAILAAKLQYICTNNVSYDSILKNVLCWSDCYCDDVKYMPVCNQLTQISYYSPCHAGCKNYTSNLHQTIFLNCTCCYDNERETYGDFVTKGLCNSKCNFMSQIYQTLDVFGELFNSAITAMQLIITIRCVPLMDRLYVVPLDKTLTNIIAFLPAKLLYSSLCNVLCEACLIFDTYYSYKTVVIVSMVMVILSILFTILGTIYTRKLSIFIEPNFNKPPVRPLTVSKPSTRTIFQRKVSLSTTVDTLTENLASDEDLSMYSHWKAIKQHGNFYRRESTSTDEFTPNATPRSRQAQLRKSEHHTARWDLGVQYQTGSCQIVAKADVHPSLSPVSQPESRVPKVSKLNEGSPKSIESEPMPGTSTDLPFYNVPQKDDEEHLSSSSC